LTTAWGNSVLSGLSARAKVLFSAGRFIAADESGVMFALPNAAHRDHCAELSPQVEDALTAHFGVPVTLVLVVDNESAEAPVSDGIPMRPTLGPVRRPLKAPVMAPITGPPHPAQFSTEVLVAIVEVIVPWAMQLGRSVRVLDPFAGVGGIHLLARQSEQAPPALFGPAHNVETVGVEIEPEWAGQHPRTIVGDATVLPFPDACFDVVATSPTYGNRMADHHNARDGSTRITYRHKLGRALTPGNSGAMQWGEPYRALHICAWEQARRVLRPDGLMLLNVSNHIRKGKEIPVVEWHMGTLDALGFIIKDDIAVPTARMRFGANHSARVAYEHVIVASRP